MSWPAANKQTQPFTFAALRSRALRLRREIAADFKEWP
jgi:hypothetical protein